MFNTNLVLPLLALGMYSHCHNINLANNTSLLIIVLALALQQREINKINCDNTDNNGSNTYSRTTNATFNNTNGRSTFTTASNFPFTTFPCATSWNNGTWWNNSGCPCQNANWQTFTTPCGNAGCVVY